MEKKEIYEHLAQIYLDASTSTKHKKKKSVSFFQPVFFVTVALFIGAAFFVARGVGHTKKSSLNSQHQMILADEAIRLSYNFDPARKAAYSLQLNRMSLNRFKALSFSLKKAYPQDQFSLRIEFTNVFKESSEIYIKDIAGGWQQYRILLSQFKGISDWSEMANLSFSIEEWNSKEKKGIVYIDNLKFLE